MKKEVDDYFHDDPTEEAPEKKIFFNSPLKLKLSGLALISFLSYTLLGTTYSANIQFGSGRIEYGQGVTQSIACDSSVTTTLTPTSSSFTGSVAATSKLFVYPRSGGR